MNTIDYDAVIFDCDGVLVDSEIRMTEYWVAELNRLGCEFTRETYACRMLGLSDTEYLIELAAAAGRDLPITTLLAIADREMDVLRGVPPILGMPNLVRALQTPSCVASSSTTERLAEILHAAGFSASFEGAVFSSSLVERGKPAPDIFLYAARQLTARPDRCVVVEDSPHGVAGAKAAGMRTVGFCGGSHMFPAVKEKLMGSGVDALANDAAELASILGIHMG